MIWIALGCLPFVIGFVVLMFGDNRREWLIAMAMTALFVISAGVSVVSIMYGLIEIGGLRQ